MQALQRGWSENLSALLNNVKSELTISSPYFSDAGADFILNAVSDDFKERGLLRFITDLSPNNIYQGSTNPFAFATFFQNINLVQIFHLPRLHAKVYVRDNKEAIVTSGNLTAGGLYNNFEYGVYTDDNQLVSFIKNDLTDYGNLGALINSNDIQKYCTLSDKVKEIYRKKEKIFSKKLEIQFNEAILEANDELIKIKLAGGKIHPVFEKTIYYLLQKNGALKQEIINNLIQEIHPDLCDDNVDRIINDIHFGKKWKHAARTSLQTMKKKGIVELIDGKWQLIK
ncbi:MAG: phospholipase D-like domain-containing protein [Ignavibacteria bacterium]|jgi:phosphatidylserine/phosphatidylglycerophosphate/cardiolipin synthase-like enzyme|nr:phospholipase D-like domain-containing protein [Ignavibacteria bacterium]